MKILFLLLFLGIAFFEIFVIIKSMQDEKGINALSAKIEAKIPFLFFIITS
ncbi:MAG: hypothetical protein PHP37_00020 [Patescibacteria group bacterium]|nr:hypothetical protein [Patescibacteria group bacterium]